MTLVERVKDLIAKTDYTGRYKKDVDRELAVLLGCSYSLVSKIRSGNYNWRLYYRPPLSSKQLAKQRCLERNQELGKRARRAN